MATSNALADQVTLVLTHPGNAVGAIRGTGGINSTCRPKCEQKYERGSVVTLEATTSGNKDRAFDRWEGACKGQGSTCKLSMTENKSAELHMKVVQGYVDVTFKSVGATG